MLVGRRAEELAQPGRRGVLERRRYRARIVRPGAGGAAGENLGKPNQDRAWESATGQCPRLSRTTFRDFVRGGGCRCRVRMHGREP
jgi:hypothetical protein